MYASNCAGEFSAMLQTGSKGKQRETSPFLGSLNFPFCDLQKWQFCWNPPVLSQVFIWGNPVTQPSPSWGSLHYTPEHCLVNGGFPLFWWQKPCFKCANVFFKEPCFLGLGQRKAKENTPFLGVRKYIPTLGCPFSDLLKRLTCGLRGKPQTD